MKRFTLKTIAWVNVRCKSASIRLTKIAGKSPVPMHPKHLIPEDESKRWYLNEIQPGMRILDIGSGSGKHAMRAAEKGATVIGFDYNLVNLQRAIIISQKQALDSVGFFQGSAEDRLPFPSNSFDQVMLLDVIEHLYHRTQILQEIKRILQPDGLLSITAPNRDTRWKRQLRSVNLPSITDPDHKIEYIWPEFIQELKNGGFEPLTAPQPIVYDTPFAGFIDLTGVISLSIYQKLAKWKFDMAQRHPSETSGWRVVCKPIHS